MSTSPFLAIQRLETSLKNILGRIDVEMLDQAEKKAITDLKRQVVEARLDIRDYELSETREEQLKCAAVAKKRLAKLRANLLAAGTVFGAVDVAQLDAELEQIKGWIE